MAKRNVKGNSDKDAGMNKAMMIGAVVIAVLIIVLLIMFFNPVSRAKRMDISELDSKCQTIDYDAYISAPEEYKGEYVKLRVQIYQKVNDRLFNVYTAAEGETDDDSWMGEHYLLNDDRHPQDPELEEGLIVTVYGRCAGLQKMTAAEEGGANGLPSIDVILIDFEGYVPEDGSAEALSE